MLEYSSLWLSTPTTAWPSGQPRTGHWLRHVLHGESRDLLGYIAISPGRLWPKRVRLAAYEVPDGSLVFSIRPAGWLRQAFVVTEADANPVALIRGECVASSSSQVVARRRTGDNEVGTFVSPAGAELVRWEPEGGGTTVHFTDYVRGQPFLKMGLLAAILVTL